MGFRGAIVLPGLLLVLSVWPAPTQTPEPPSALERLPVITTVAYITAHPDDESGPVLTYLVRGMGARVVLLCLTRGEGGQNTYGPELWDELARVRTQELEAAGRIYGVEVRFLEAPDFGYSKSVEETLRYWKEPVLVERLVRALRELKPDVIISHWTPEAPAGAQHQAAGIVAREAYRLVGDPAAFPDAEPWAAPYFLTVARGPEVSESIRIPVEDTDPRTGKTYEEIGWEGVRQHRSQGLDRFDPRGVRGRSYSLRVEALRAGAPVPRVAGDLVQRLDGLSVLFPQVRALADWQERLARVVQMVEEASRALSAEGVEKLVAGAALLEELREELQKDPAARPARELVESRQQAFLRAAARLAGIEVTARADRARVVPGERFRLRVTLKRGLREVVESFGLRAAGDLQLQAPEEWGRERVLSEASEAALVYDFSVAAPLGARPGPVPIAVSSVVEAHKGRLPFQLAAEVRGPQGELVEVVPPVWLALEPLLRLVPKTLAGGMLDWEVRVEHNGVGGDPLPVALEVPEGWTPPLAQAVPGQNPGVLRLRFQALLPARLEAGEARVRAVAGTAAAEARVQVVDVSVPRGLRIGYIGFDDDPVPALLAQLGVGVDMLNERVLPRARLDGYDAVVMAERAYDFREELEQQTPRLLDYVRRGGTLVIEHQGRRWDAAKLAPYPAEKSGNLRVTDETAPVRVLAPDHPALNFPHRITDADWQGWVHERGLYFLSSWDAQYTPLVEMADPGEEPLRGGLVYARYGQGVYIYCGLALFRQVRAGVPGGIRLFVNLLSQRRAARTAHETSSDAPEFVARQRPLW